MNQYSRVSYAERCQIFACLQAKLSVPEIANLLNRHKTTIYREIKRNSQGIRLYRPVSAQNKTEARVIAKFKEKKIQGEFEELIIRLLKSGLSAEQVSGRLKIENHDSVSTETIYKYINSSRETRKLRITYNRRGFSRYRKLKMKSRQGLSIHDRPKIINSRARFGDWERDGMYGANKKQLLVLTERKSRFTLLEALPNVRSKTVSELTLKTLLRSKGPIKSLTNDNGTEFRGENTLGIPIYYCDPLKPQQRGTIENTIGRLRRDIKQKTDLDELGRLGLDSIERKINMTPRKCLKFKTPFEVFYKTKVALTS